MDLFDKFAERHGIEKYAINPVDVAKRVSNYVTKAQKIGIPPQMAADRLNRVQSKLETLHTATAGKAEKVLAGSQGRISSKVEKAVKQKERFGENVRAFKAQKLDRVFQGTEETTKYRSGR